MAVPIIADPWTFLTSEAVYQACKFAALPEVQQRIDAGVGRTAGLGIDPGWNAQRVDVISRYEGWNVLGRLWMELRKQLRDGDRPEAAVRGAMIDWNAVLTTLPDQFTLDAMSAHGDGEHEISSLPQAGGRRTLVGRRSRSRRVPENPIPKGQKRDGHALTDACIVSKPLAICLR